MPFREKVKRAFRRGSDNTKNTKPKVEYYRRGECPRSKYRGPVDPEHRRRLYDWTFAAATADRPRSFDLDLSPCTSLPDRPQHEQNDDVEDNGTAHSKSESEAAARGPHVQIMGSITVAHHEEAPSGSFDTISDQSTAVMSSCRSSSLTLKDSWDWRASWRGALPPLKQSSSFTRRISAPEKRLPFDPQDLRTALSAVSIVT